MKGYKIWILLFLCIVLTIAGIIFIIVKINNTKGAFDLHNEVALDAIIPEPEAILPELEEDIKQEEEAKQVEDIKQEEIIPKEEIKHEEIQQEVEEISSDESVNTEKIEIHTSEPTPITKPLTGAVIGIDAGHQGKGNSSPEPVAPNSSVTKAKVSSGTTGVATGIPEYVINLEVALLLEQYLKELGAEVIMTRTSHDVDISNAERAVVMNENNVDLCIRIHINGSSNSSVRGALLMLPKGEVTKSIQGASYKAGEIVYKNYIAETGLKDTGVLYVDDLTGFNWSAVPVILIEMGFMSNPEDDTLLSNPDFQTKCAAGMANGVAEWYSGLQKN